MVRIQERLQADTLDRRRATEQQRTSISRLGTVTNKEWMDKSAHVDYEARRPRPPCRRGRRVR